MQSAGVNLDVLGATLIAQELNVPVEQLGVDIFRLATWIEGMGNKGFSTGRLEQNQSPVYFLPARYDAAWRGILFYGEGSRKRDFSGWGVRKSPHWTLIWGDRFGWDTVTGRGIVDNAEVEAYAEKVKQDVRFERQRLNFCQGSFDKFSSIEIGHRWAAAEILNRRYERLRWEADDGFGSSLMTYQALVWNEQAYYMKWELEWRVKHHAKDAERDTAKRILEQGLHYFYTKQTVDKWISAKSEPMFASGDFEQPYDDVSQHAEFMSEAQVRRVFVELVQGERKDIGQEDIDLVLRILRKQLANLKGGFE